RGPVGRGGTGPGAPALPGSEGKRAAGGETAQAAEPEARSGRQVVQTEAERHRAGGGAARAGARERLGVVVVSVHKQKLEVGPAKQGTSGTEEAASLRVVRQVAEVAQRDERVAALPDGTLDQTAQLAPVAVQVAKGEQTAQTSRAYRARSCSPAGGSAPVPADKRRSD